MSRRDDTTPDALPGQVGPYRVLGELGRGGMGWVLRAVDPDLGRTLAVKVLPAGAAPELRARFLREGRTAARLRHPGIVMVHGAGEDDGVCWIAQECVEGRTLAAALAEEPLPPVRAAAVMEGVARALAHAHAEGVIHRDVKPGNIVLDADGAPRLLDFGLARDVAGTQALSQSGTIIGTPEYMAPEQAEGRVGAIDGRTDVWACGATLYECVAGRPPFRAEGMLGVVTAVVNDDPPPLREHAPGVPRPLERIVRTCLQKDPARRYPTALALADDLARFQRGESILAAGVGPVTRARDWIARHRSTAGLAAAAAAVVAAAAARWFVVAAGERAATAEQFRIARELTAAAPAQALGLLQALEAGHPDWPGLPAARAAAVAARDRVVRERGRAPARVLLDAARRSAATHADCEQRLTVLTALPAAMLAERTAAVATVLRERDAAYAGARACLLAVGELLAADPAAPERAAALAALAELAAGRRLDAARRNEPGAVAAFSADLQLALDGDADGCPTDGRVALATHPPGATVAIWRYVDHDGVAVAERVADVGPTPVADWVGPPGSYLWRLRHPACAEACWPVRVVAGERVAATIPLLTVADLGDTWVYVPAGPSVLGGDPTAPGTHPWRCVPVPGFLMARFEVTTAEYVAFLRAVAARDGMEAVRPLAPRDARWHFWSDGRVETDAPPAHPVMHVPYEAAEAFAAWRAEVTGLPIRLPTEDEWERAGRGADGRPFPWGTRLDWSLLVGGDGPAGGRLQPVGTAVGDVSPFGVRDLAGSVKEFCRGWGDAGRRIRPTRGGGYPYSDPAVFRLAGRSGYEPGESGRTGIRLVRDLPR